jgi:hypothetical protein
MSTSVYKSFTHGSIPLSSEGKRLLQNLRYAIQTAIRDGSYSVDDNAVAHARGELAMYMSALEHNPLISITCNNVMDAPVCPQKYGEFCEPKSVLPRRAVPPAIADTIEWAPRPAMVATVQWPGETNSYFADYFTAQKDLKSVLKEGPRVAVDGDLYAGVRCLGSYKSVYVRYRLSCFMPYAHSGACGWWPSDL